MYAQRAAVTEAGVGTPETPICYPLPVPPPGTKQRAHPHPPTRHQASSRSLSEELRLYLSCRIKLGCWRQKSGENVSGLRSAPQLPGLQGIGAGTSPAHLLLQTDAKLLRGQRGPRGRRLGGRRRPALVQALELLIVPADTTEAGLSPGRGSWHPWRRWVERATPQTPAGHLGVPSLGAHTPCCQLTDVHIHAVTVPHCCGLFLQQAVAQPPARVHSLLRPLASGPTLAGRAASPTCHAVSPEVGVTTLSSPECLKLRQTLACNAKGDLYLLLITLSPVSGKGLLPSRCSVKIFVE